MRTKEEIRKIIVDAIENIAGVRIKDFSVSLISKDVDINPADFLYIFQLLEKKLSLPVYQVFEEYTYDVMSIENLSNALYELEKVPSTHE